MALVWKQTASSVARATWPRFVWPVMPTGKEVSGSAWTVGKVGGLTDCALRVVDPVRSEESTEGRHEHEPAVVIHRLRELGNAR